MDWAGPHGTAWGTVNACLTTITAAWVTHLVHLYWPASVGSTILAAVGATVLGMVSTLLRAAFGKSRQPATIVYKLACWFGVGAWLVVILRSTSWSVKFFAAHVGALIVLALVAGICAGLASDEPPAAAVPVVPPAPTMPVSADPAQAALDALAIEWETRINEFCPGDGYKVPNIEHWPRKNGYYVQVLVPASGGRDFNSVLSHVNDFAADMDLVGGGKIDGAMGTTRRVAILEVTTVDLLAEETVYPVDRAVHSIRDDLQVGLQDNGSPIGPNLWQLCMLLAGETRSGKTNAGHCLTAEIGTTDDALEWKYELTGGGFWASWMRDWLLGLYETPPLDWCAFDGRELLWMTRAAVRVGYARKPGYRDLMHHAEDDKLPVSRKVPAIIVSGDEIAKITGNMSEHPEAAENLRLIVFELGAAAVRAVFLALRGTDDVISSSIQSQLHVRAVMKVNTKSEASWALGPGHDFGPEQTPYPGSGGIVLGSGMPVQRIKWHRMLPSRIQAIAKVASTRRPALDDLSRMAANGRNPDGSPMTDLHSGELDCYDTRWDRFRAWSNANGSAPRAAQAKQAAPQPDTGTITPAQAEANMRAAMTAVDERIAELDAARSDNGVNLSDEQRADSDRLLASVEGLAEAMAAEGFGDDWVVDESYDETPPQPADRQAMLDLIRAASPNGIKPQDLLGELATAGIIFSRDTLHSRLNELKAAGLVHQPSFGLWAIGEKK